MGTSVSALNPVRVAEVRAVLRWVRELRLQAGRESMPYWRRHVAQQLLRAAGLRADVWKPWDDEIPLWVCRCCMLVQANGECCDGLEHGGDGVKPWSATDLTVSTVAAGGEHASNRCYLDGGCGCEFHEFESDPCDGCGSRLAGSRYAMTLFVNDRRS